jgi:hypothetical protein
LPSDCDVAHVAAVKDESILAPAANPMPDTSDITRIGRPANPAERGLQVVVENAAVLERVGRNLLGAVKGWQGGALERAWRRLSEDEKEVWRAEALERLRAHVEAYRATQPPRDPDPGAAVPPLARDDDVGQPPLRLAR